ncbi:radical SAM family RiPP maturation amino acid epimerase [Alishewanella sp. HH-ZS]|uniref:radical SAM family RiPP maturation amino acid epimerase n=1 Tax=Alishewanella sp. HH-ZS TaxID=1856684 RepID=UPI000823729F|nr:radical SAM family RiPP maturation amino acid epimerase [Alishewanella sp. HH-ZS]OCW96212.1 hypothetical protein A9165_12810 [Alishewanella sp. HH-ZS]
MEFDIKKDVMVSEKYVSPYTRFISEKNSEELRELSHIKRFLECYGGDSDFRQQVKNGSKNLDELAESVGVKLKNIESLRPIIDPEYSHFRKDATRETWPLTAKWDEYYANIMQSLAFYLQSGNTDGEFKEFDLWRNRQIIRTLLDVGSPAASIVHPPVAFELSDGCSVGCWFCGISAKKFGGHFALDKSGDVEWENTLISVKKVLGKGLRTGFCYWATEPLDNPDYDKFISKYYEIVGTIPQTTTAIPLKDISLTRKVLKLWDESKFVPNRFSVLSTSILKKIHAEFTPEELLGVELVMQGKGSITSKSIAGKAIDERNRKREDSNMQEGTIACVTGFLINIRNKTIRLVSPTLPSKQWPDGYYVFSSEKYKEPHEIENIMRKMIIDEVKRETDSNQKIGLNEGFWLDSINEQLTVRNQKFGLSMKAFEIIAPLLKEGSNTPTHIVKQAVKSGCDPILAIRILQDMMLYGMTGNDYLRPASIKSMEELIDINIVN